ncbi:hypothetical protein [Enterobacter hormaechei]
MKEFSLNQFMKLNIEDIELQQTLYDDCIMINVKFNLNGYQRFVNTMIPRCDYIDDFIADTINALIINYCAGSEGIKVDGVFKDRIVSTSYLKDLMNRSKIYVIPKNDLKPFYLTKDTINVGTYVDIYRETGKTSVELSRLMDSLSKKDFMFVLTGNKFAN